MNDGRGYSKDSTFKYLSFLYILEDMRETSSVIVAINYMDEAIKLRDKLRFICTIWSFIKCKSVRDIGSTAYLLQVWVVN